MTKRSLSLLLMMIGFLAYTPAQAQIGLGVKALYGLDSEEAQLGGELHVPIGSVTGLTFVPTLEVYLTDNPDVLSINANFHYAPPVGAGSSVRPYFGLGIGAIRVSIDRRGEDIEETKSAFNVLGGVNFRTAGSLTPFVQIQYRASDFFEEASIGGGLRFVL
ncbi:MAG TPA: outer membrane beta-barrel protein [Rhodothermales bacterium]|nr:outer membrane beta-barrel protein [Rhodothermales bacterium]